MEDFNFDSIASASASSNQPLTSEDPSDKMLVKTHKCNNDYDNSDVILQIVG